MNQFLNLKRSDLSKTFTYKEMERNPITWVKYGKYDITIYKINLTENKPLTEIITEISGDDGIQGYGPYSIVNKGNYELNYKCGSVPTVSRIQLILDVDSSQILKKNDSIVYYYIRFNQLSLKYNGNDTTDIVISKKEHIMWTKSIPANLLLRKRDKDLYLFLMTCSDTKIADKNFLYKLLIK